VVTKRPRIKAFMPAPGGAFVSSPRASRTTMSTKPEMNSLQNAALRKARLRQDAAILGRDVTHLVSTKGCGSVNRAVPLMSGFRVGSKL